MRWSWSGLRASGPKAKLMSEWSQIDSEVTVHNKMRLPEFRKGKDGPQIFSAGVMNVLSRTLRALTNPQIVRGEKDEAVLTDSNFVLTLARSADGSGSGSVARMYRLKSVQDDYVTVRSWNGADEGSQDIQLAKEYKLRCSLTGETIFGITHTYSYATGPDSLNKQRTNNDGTNTETEIIVPPWTLNEIVFALPVRTDVLLSGSNLPLLILRNAQWAKYP